MQRVAAELIHALVQRRDLTTRTLALQGSWRWQWLWTAPFVGHASLLAVTLARRRQVDAVVFSSVLGAVLLTPLIGWLQRHGVPCVAIAHGQDVIYPWAAYQCLVRCVLSRLAAVAAVSSATGEASLVRGLAPSHLRIVPNGVDTSRFPPRATLPAARAVAATARQQHVPQGSFVLCSVGRHVPRKGFAWFVDEVMPRLPENVHYWLAGAGPETPAIARAIDRRHLHRRVRLLGTLPEPELVQFYCTADLFVMPNITVAGTMEGFGVVLLEAAACGLPALAARLEGIQDVLTDGQTGVLVPSGDAGGFAAVIVRLQRDPSRLAALSARAAADAGQRTWEEVADRHAVLLRQVVGGHAGAS
jgi:phosphatidylinositol alpha-1,6-mannosyltransferase